MASRQLVVFSIDNENFGIEINNVNSIQRVMDIFKIPNAPSYVEGLINLMGKVHTVFNLRKRFDLPAREFDEETKIIMVNTSSSSIGIIVDEVKEIIRVEEEDIEYMPDIATDAKGKFVTGVAKTGDGVIMLLDLDSTLNLRNDEVPVKT